MSEQNTAWFNKDTMVNFAIIVEGDVAFTSQYPLEAENAIAALRSNPQIVEIPEEIKNSVGNGWTFDGENFIPPLES